MKKTIYAIATVATLCVASYYFGLNKRESYNNFPINIKKAIEIEHNSIDSCIKNALQLFYEEKSIEAVSKYKVAKKRLDSLKKIDPNF
jgi:hypothetical protein